MFSACSDTFLAVKCTFKLASIRVGIDSAQEDGFKLERLIRFAGTTGDETRTWFMPALAKRRVGSS